MLNEALALDPDAMFRLIESRVPCNALLACHPSIQTGSIVDGVHVDTVGPLGLLNGIFGVDSKGWGFIAAVYSDDLTRIERFIVRETT